MVKTTMIISTLIKQTKIFKWYNAINNCFYENVRGNVSVRSAITYNLLLAHELEVFQSPFSHSLSRPSGIDDLSLSTYVNYVKVESANHND